MTRVGFYIIENTDADSRPRLALRLAEKAHKRGHRIFINSETEAQARQLNELLWSFRPASFLPHALSCDDANEQICIGWGQEPQGHDDLLINLQTSVPDFIGRFQRVAELVNQEPARLEALRDSWRHYRERGYALEEHRLPSV
ncbi:DNA polymerase III subunit chi [Congregibacter sp.]|uniref:DNA polymerase III subunit chi n=1 Tax=Congregibacter sp. TaxID=2744308 RepID=UPI0038600439